MKYSIVSKELTDALGRCTTVCDGYVLAFTNRPVKKESNESGLEVYASISACTTSGISAMSTITLTVTKCSDCTTDSKETVKIIVGADFADAAKALCKAGDAITLSLKDNYLELSYGDAKIEVSCKDKVSSFAVKSPKDNAHAKFQVSTKEWKRVIQQSGFTCGTFDETSPRAVLNNILLFPCIVGESYGIRTCSSNGYYGSSSYCIVEEPDEAFVEMVNAANGVLIPPAVIKSLSSVLKREVITVFVFDNQLMIRDGNDVFVIVLASGRFPMNLLSMFDETDYTYSLKADTADLKVALDIVSVNCKDANKAALKLEVSNSGVVLYAQETANKAPVKSETEGAVIIGICIKQLKELITSGITEVNQVSICGKNDSSMVHVRGGHCSAFTLPVILSSSATDDEN